MTQLSCGILSSSFKLNSFLKPKTFQILSVMDKRAERLLKKEKDEAGETVSLRL